VVLCASEGLDPGDLILNRFRRIAAIISLGPALDASYEAVKADVWEWGEG
jgi:hypothetical protein